MNLFHFQVTRFSFALLIAYKNSKNLTLLKHSQLNKKFRHLRIENYM